MLYNINLASLALGCLLKQPSLLAQPQYPLSKNDFSPEQFHKILYLAIQRLYNEGVSEVTEVEVEKAGRGLIAIEHHGVATLRFAGTRVEQGLAVAHITVGQALPTLLAIVPFANILATDVKLVVHGRTHLVDVASRGRTILVAITQASAGAGGVHQHRHGGVLLERSGAAKLHEVVTHRGAGGQREGNSK